MAKHARFRAGGRTHHGILADGVLVDEAGREYQPGEVTWLPPVDPGHLFALALNYSDHAEELELDLPDEPVLFVKPSSTVTAHNQPVYYPHGAEKMHYEVELAVVIGDYGRRVPESEAMDLVAGYTIANDLTVRDYITDYYRPPVKAKGFDTFCPLGPVLVDADDLDPSSLELTAAVNGEIKQRGNTSQLIHTVPMIIAYLSEFMTLEPGDVILTGTPKGIHFIQPGDELDLTIDGIGTLHNTVAPEPPTRT